MDLQTLKFLLSDAGQNLIAELKTLMSNDTSELRSQEILRSKYPSWSVSAAVELLLLRHRARDKFSRADRMFFTRVGLEQSSSEVVSRYRAQRYKLFENIADLCTGIGGDLISLAEGRSCTAVDIDPVHLMMAEVNANVYEARPPDTVLADVRELAFEDFEAVFIDPSRRAQDKRILDPRFGEPPLDWCLSISSRIKNIGIKTSPGLDKAIIPDGWEVEFISLRGDLKEAVLWSPSMSTAKRRATLLPGEHTLAASSVAPAVVDHPGRYILDPDPAVTRAGLVSNLAREIDAWMLDERIAFLSADSYISTPFARTWEVVYSGRWSLKQLRSVLIDLDAGSIDIRKRRSPLDTDQLRKKLGAALKGNKRYMIFLTEIRDKPWMFICS